MRRFIKWLSSSLLLRVALALALVGLVPVGILASRLIDINRSAMEEQVRLTHVRLARSTASEVSARVAAIRNLALGLARHEALELPRSAEARRVLGQSLAAWTDLGVVAIAVVAPQGERVISAQLNDDRVRSWVERMFEAPAHLTVHGTPIAEDFVVRVAAPLQGERGQVWLVADGTAIRDSVDNYELGHDAQVTLANRNGEAVLGSVEGFATELLEHAESQWVDGFSNSQITDTGGFVGAHAAVGGTDWMILSRQPLSVAHEVALTMSTNARLALGLAAGLVLLLSTVAYASVVRPIRQLAQAQRRLAGLGGGEIGQLRSSFEALEQRLKEQSALDEVFLGRFQVREVLGSGAMGTVFLGFDPKLERPVALKTLRLDRELSVKRRADLLSRLVKEAVVTAKFNHPNIVAIYDVQEGEDSAFLAMEFVDGTSLEPFVWNKRQLAPDQAVVLGAQVAHGLAAAHQHGLVHRDIKPANILLGKDGSIKITDFGIAELLSSMAPNDDVVFGTPGYLPPETLQGKGHDQASDLFALGAVLYFCITGRRPFEGKTVKEVIRKTLFGSARAPSELVPDVPKELEALILSLLNAEPRRRPSTADGVAKRLEDLVAKSDAQWNPPESGVTSPSNEAGSGHSSGTGYLPTVRL
jgi:hypothetical protein